MERCGRGVIAAVMVLAALGSTSIVLHASAQESELEVTTPGQLTAVEGASILLPCSYSPHTSPGQLGYLSWSKGDTIIVTYECVQACELVYSEGATADKYALNVDVLQSGNLTILGVGLEDEATYTCSVFNSDFQVASSVTSLTVNVPPNGVLVSNDWSSSYPNNSIVQIQIDQPYDLRCSIAFPSKPTSVITWEADGIAISMDDQIDEPNADDSRLMMSHRIVHVTPGRDDTGKALRCLVTHPSTGLILTSNIVLDIQACPSSVIVDQCPSVISGYNATLGCRSASTSPPPVLYWLLDSVRVDNASADVRRMTTEEGTNIVTFTRQFTKKDIDKDFVCCIERSTMCSQLCSAPCKPDIRYPPSTPQVFSSIPLDSVEENVRLEVNCTADANPIGRSNITWVRINESGDTVGPRSRSPLRFDVVNRTDAGMYRCTVNNGIGSSRSIHTKIIVLHGPNISNNRESRVHGNEGDDARLTCSAEAYPAPTITWLTPDNRTVAVPSPDVTTSIMQQTDYSIHVSSLLHISSIDSAINYGDYRCIVRNDYGTSEFVINLSGVSKPNAPYGVKFNNEFTTRTSLTVGWQAGHDGGAPQTFTVTSCRQGADEKCTVHCNIREQQYNITDLQPYSWYVVNVTGVNAYGESDPSLPVRNSTTPLPPNEFDVMASYDSKRGMVKVSRTSNQTGIFPNDICFHLKVRVIVDQLDKTCLGVGDSFEVGSAVTSSQLWLVTCGRGVCSEPDQVLFPTEAEKSIDPKDNELNIMMLSIIIASATIFVCSIFFLAIFLACRWNKRRGPQKLHKQMCSRKLPTLPRSPGAGPPSPTCQEATESQMYDGLEMGSVNRYMEPYAQTTLAESKAKESDNNQNESKEESAPPSGKNVKQNHNSEGTYTTRLQYLPMNSPNGTPSSPSTNGHAFVTENETTSHGYIAGSSDVKEERGNVDVATGLLIDFDSGDKRRPPGDEEDMGYYSVPKGTRALDNVGGVSETTPALSAY